MMRFRISGPRAAWTCLATALTLFALGCGPAPEGAGSADQRAHEPLTAAGAQAFIDRAEAKLLALNVGLGHASWVQSNFITYDTQILAAEANERLVAESVRLAKEAARFDGLDLPYDVERKLALLKLSLTLPAPADPAKTAETTRLAAALESAFGTGRYCRTEDECYTIDELEKKMGEIGDEAELRDLWIGWRTVSAGMRPDYVRLVELANEGAVELGYPDLGTMWRSKYDMPPEAFAAELDRLWEQVKPLYDALHCHVRARLAEEYGTDVVPLDGPIPAHLLGNMWAQTWTNLYPVVGPADADPGYDLTERLEAAGVDAVGMVKIGEGFFTSLGFDPLPDTFWERSLFTRPRDRDVVCHASAWSIDYENDLRIKMCIAVDGEDFNVIHHELGHNFYQRAYNQLPFLYQDSANDGFHEAVGDTIALSVTPGYLVSIGLLDAEPATEKDTGLLLKMALDKISFLPFGLLIDQWRWKVFSGEITPETYNQGWWDLRTKYQGIAPPVARDEADFDPGAKYHVPGNVPYTRYFLADILQFQFHRALCQAAGYEGPLHRCSIYANAEAGEKLRNMLAMGLSRPWPEALEAATGSSQMDATAILDYFAPLKEWLDEQNQGRTCGW